VAHVFADESNKIICVLIFKNKEETVEYNEAVLMKWMKAATRGNSELLPDRIVALETDHVPLTFNQKLNITQIKRDALSLLKFKQQKNLHLASSFKRFLFEKV